MHKHTALVTEVDAGGIPQCECWLDAQQQLSTSSPLNVIMTPPMSCTACVVSMTAAQLPPHSLQQMLLLQPGLLVDLLEAASAAVLQPVLSAAGPASSVRDPCTGQASESAQQPHHGSSTGGSGAGGMRIMQSVLAASCPWILWLPSMLAHNPLLLLKVSPALYAQYQVHEAWLGLVLCLSAQKSEE